MDNIKPTHQIYFNDGSVEEVEGVLPPPELEEEVAPGVVNAKPNYQWWDCVLLHLDENSKTHQHFGLISVNLRNVLFIKKM
jgi:hypothetical protein